jgi:hypothetical protein
MTYEEQLRRYEEKLDPKRIRSTLAFAGLFQLTHELLKSSVLDDVKSFYGFVDVGDGAWLPKQGEHEYGTHVVALDPNRFRGSLMWLQSMEAISAQEADRLDDIYAHRHQLTHELGNYLLDPDLEPDFDLLVDALTILRKICRFWVEVEAGIGTFEDFGPDLDLDDVVPGRIMVLDMCVRAYAEGLGVNLDVLRDESS